MKNTKLKPLSKRAIAELETVVSGIEKGKLQHNQSYIHCGTAHCICGWLEMRHFASQAKIPMATIKTVEFFDNSPVTSQSEKLLGEYRSQVADNLNIHTTSPWWLVVARLGLTRAESYSLFKGSLTIEDIRDTLELLKKGLRNVSNSQWDVNWIDTTTVDLVINRDDESRVENNG